MSDNNSEGHMPTEPTKQNPPPQLAWVKLFFVICFPLLLVFPYFRQLWK
jgi:hypothetical protein